ncbi:MAG: pantoate--beta-alanine ligase [Clostridia bacterium]|nr:pantoate--beta-alanine ligase [Clostridia bacterium]
MKVVRTIADVRAAVAEARGKGLTVGFVPTMGYFHEGHLSLMRKSVSENGFTVVSLYVNPLQFAPTEDLAQYPRDFERDVRMAGETGVDVLFAPDDAEMYPDGPEAHRTIVSVRGLNAVLCGRSRPTHFDGVTTVVSKLFHIVAPDRAYFGQKDYQQALIIRRMVRDLNIPVEIRVAPIVREPDGLAMSSRNAYLTPDERAAAPVLYRTLSQAAAMIRDGERDAGRIRSFLRDTIAAAPHARLDYAEVVDPDTLADVDVIDGPVLLAVACYFGRARLIDNMLVTP